MLSSRSVQPSLDAGAFGVASWGADRQDAGEELAPARRSEQRVIDLNGRPAAIPPDTVELMLPDA